jgi:hypothetical protein
MNWMLTNREPSGSLQGEDWVWSQKGERALSRPHFSPWRQHVYPKRRHRPANTHGAKTKDLYNMTLITMRASNLICYCVCCFSIFSLF